MESKLVHFLHNLGFHRGRIRGRHARVQESESHQAHEIYQVSTINALLAGNYDGELAYGELMRHGDFGIGTFNGLDGEMVALDGAYYQIKADGVAHPVREAQRTPFAVVQDFQPDFQTELPEEADYAHLKATLCAVLPSCNLFYAVRVDGTFAQITARSAHRQAQPYPPLDKAVENQSVFEFADIDGSLIGFRFPDFAAGRNMPGYHLHFISADRKVGGHLLECRVIQAELLAEHTDHFHVELPDSQLDVDQGMSQEQSAALHRAED